MDTPTPTAPAPRPLAAMGPSQIIGELAKLNGWKLHGDGADVAIEKTFRFKNFLRTMAFVNAVAYVAEQQDHHPELLVSYRQCSVRFNTHDVRGISMRDFRCAALVDALVPAEGAPA